MLLHAPPSAAASVLSGSLGRPRIHAARPSAPRSGAIASATRRGRRSATDLEAEEEGSSAAPAGPPQTAEQKAKAKALREAIFKINQKHGPNSIMQMTGGFSDVERIPSGCLTLDKALGGGYPRGRIVEVFGPEASGKTTLALHAIAEVQRMGGKAVFIDAEHAFDSSYAARVGIDMNDMFFSQPDYGEQAFNIMDEIVRSGGIDLVVVDSVSALVPRSEVEGDIGTPQIGAQARLMSHALRKIASNASKSGCTIMFINQLRFKVGVLFGNPETTSGGNALKYYASMRLDIRSRDKIVEAGKAEPVGNRVKVKVVKNKVSPPFETAEFDIMYGSGISATGCVFDVAKELGVLEARGSHYYFEGAKLAQGRDNALQFLEDNPDTTARITTATKARMAELASSGGGRAATAAARRASALSADDADDVIGGGDDDALPDAFDEEELLDDEALLKELEGRAGGL